MKVHEVIKQLQQQDPDAEVHLSYNYGDHWQTEVAPKVGYVGGGVVTHSDYHRMDKVVQHDEHEGPPARSVVIVSQWA
jgi:hypothetical protein